MGNTQPDRLRRQLVRPTRSLVQRGFGRGVVPPMVGLLGMVALTVNAQDAVTPSGFVLEPAFGVRGTVTDNVNLSNTDPRSDLITELRPQLRVRSPAGRVRGFLDYALTGYAYAKDSSQNNWQQSLSAAGTAEAVEKWAFVDASASISQQYISALGTQSPDPALNNSNRTEVASALLAPYIRGKLGGYAEYEARLTWAATRSKGTDDDSTRAQTLLRVGSDPTSLAFLGWSVDWLRQQVDFATSGKQQNDRLTGVLSFAVAPDLRLSARAGREVNDLLTLETERYNTWGGGVAWFPSERTRLEATAENRFFGTSHNAVFEHRMPRAVFRFTDRKDLSADTSDQFANGPSRTVFDLLFEQFASIAPDPVQRAALVDAYLQNNGLTRTTLATGGFLTSNVTVQSRQDLSFAILGIRSTALVSAYRNNAYLLDPTTTATGNLAGRNSLVQTGVSVNLSHRVTPLSAISVDFARTRTDGKTDGIGADEHTELRSVTASWSNRVNESTDLSISARHTSFESATDPYTESALIASLTMRF